MAKITSVEGVSNGYIATNDWYEKTIHTSLTDLANHYEGDHKTDPMHLEPNMFDFVHALVAARDGRKIDAIKLVRTMFGPAFRISLKGAKEMVEAIQDQMNRQTSTYCKQDGDGGTLGEILQEQLNRVGR
jgi:hypothetical protein